MYMYVRMYACMYVHMYVHNMAYKCMVIISGVWPNVSAATFLWAKISILATLGQKNLQMRGQNITKNLQILYILMHCIFNMTNNIYRWIKLIIRDRLINIQGEQCIH